MPITTARAHLKSAAPYSQSRRYTEPPKGQKETSADYEKRTWREKTHSLPNGAIFIPSVSFKNCLDEAAQFLGMQIPGKGRSTYTKHFEAGVMVIEPLVLPVKKEEVAGEWLYMNANGRRGPGTRVDRCFPVIPEWSGVVEFTIVDPSITEDVFREHLSEAGKYIGLGRWRPRNRGMYGRFTVEKIDWQNGA